MGALKQLREEAGLPSAVSLAAVKRVLDRIGGDVDLALTALTMIPRPAWVIDLLGVHADRPVGR